MNRWIGFLSIFFIVWRCIDIAKKTDELPINNNIRVSELMVIGPNGEQMGVKSLEDAKTIANFAGLDLVLMSGNATPAVGKIMVYNKYRYETQKKQKDALKKQRETNKELKEYRLSVNIDIHDFETRVKNAGDYLTRGHKVKASIRFRGREMAHPELGREVLNKFADKLSEMSSIETPVKQEGRNMYIILAPKK